MNWEQAFLFYSSGKMLAELLKSINFSETISLAIHSTEYIQE